MCRNHQALRILFLHFPYFPNPSLPPLGAGAHSRMDIPHHQEEEERVRMENQCQWRSMKKLLPN